MASDEAPKNPASAKVHATEDSLADTSPGLSRISENKKAPPL
jgi:hypothetical protein